MTMTDPIADLLTRVRNANQAYHESVKVPSSQMKAEIARILKEEGYIEDYEVAQNNSHQILNIKLKYGPDKMRALTGIKRISKPGLRVYAGKDEMPRVLGGLGTAIISTSKGVMTGRKAKEEGLGGEVVAYIW